MHKSPTLSPASHPPVPENIRTAQFKSATAAYDAAKHAAEKAKLIAEVSNLKLRIRALNATNINLKRRVKEFEDQTRRK